MITHHVNKPINNLPLNIIVQSERFKDILRHIGKIVGKNRFKALFLKMNKKTFPFCQNTSIQKYGTQNKLQRYKCCHCNKIFTFKKKLNLTDIWFDYTIGKQTHQQLRSYIKLCVNTYV